MNRDDLMAKEKIVLAYSGGLDTSVAIAWLMNKGYDVIACCIDVGEGLDLAAIQQKATAIGAWKAEIPIGFSTLPAINRPKAGWCCPTIWCNGHRPRLYREGK